jgi:hypothetical protein
MKYFGITYKAIFTALCAFSLCIACNSGGGGGGGATVAIPDFSDLGDSCVTDEDCVSLCFMPQASTDAYCTVICDPQDAAACPEYYLCEEQVNYGYICVDSATLANGEQCTEGSQCLSGICADTIAVGMVCSECISATDCPGAEDTCAFIEEDGYSRCISPELLELGQTCINSDECNSGICSDAGGDLGSVCSICDSDDNCGADQLCIYDNNLGYEICSGTLELGADCSSSDQCTSGECRGDVCSECTDQSDCSDGGFCVDQTGDVGYYVCEGELGDSCDANDDCGLDRCFPGQDVCSECATNSDCGVSQECAYDGDDGYASCVGTADLGDSCDNDGQCVSESCNSGVCSECSSDSDCNGGTCNDDTASSGYFICEGELGEDCTENGDCGLGYCYAAEDVCSECALNSDCGVLQDCVYEGSLGYASCVGIADLGESCDIDNQCVSGYCTGGVCSDCGSNGDCDGGTCSEGIDGYYFCTTPLAGDCSENDECESGYCYDRPGPQGSICSVCELNEDCGEYQECAYDGGLEYAVCIGTAELGSSCTDGSDCVSGICNNSVCSECLGDGDCSGDGTCIDDRSGSGYFLCTDELGESCVGAIACISGYCYEGGVLIGSICSECEVADDCMPTQECNYNLLSGYASCAGTESLGASCENDYECNSGFCSGGLCSECSVGADCESDACYDDTTGVGYFVCLGALGDFCTESSACGSDYCFTNIVCSECETTGDCATDQLCNFNILSGYAECQGTAPLSDLCSSNEKCESGYCNNFVCSECLVSDDCAGGICEDERLTTGYFVCGGNYGDVCDTGDDCGSGECFDTGFAGIEVCSECDTDQDCSGGQTCGYDITVFYARCAD